jgi:uncharacterized protein YdeI (YjbR/CyaY-like superfamily)
MKIRFFKSASAFRKWLETNHTSAQELWVGFYKRTSGLPSMTWPESVDQALCFGWIDGIRKRIDENSYVIRFSPRRPSSVWSAINTKRAQELANEGLMHAAGLKAFSARKENRSGIYSYENRPAELPDPYAKTIRQNKAAWEFLQAQPPSYRKLVCWWIVSAKKEETRAKRIEKLIAVSARGQRL